MLKNKENINFPEYFTKNIIQECLISFPKKRDTIFYTGDKVKGFYYVISGEIKALRNMMSGTEVVMVRSQSGEYFGETAMAIEHYICDGVCTKNTELIFMPKETLKTAMKNSEFSMAFSLALAKNARRQCSRYERLRLHKAKDRLKHFLLCESNPHTGLLVWKSSLLELASELAIEPETLYRVLAELEKDKIIKRDKRNIQLMM
ncbi:MAG: Crp/Fnr family transcriptional regulator [Pseudomonadota bacterium]